jgi:hypothetical protein
MNSIKEESMQYKLLTQKSAGFIFIIIFAVSFGAMPIFARLTYALKVDPLTILSRNEMRRNRQKKLQEEVKSYDETVDESYHGGRSYRNYNTSDS